MLPSSAGLDGCQARSSLPPQMLLAAREELQPLGRCIAQMLFLTVAGGFLLPLALTRWPLELRASQRQRQQHGRQRRQQRQPLSLEATLARLAAMLHWPSAAPDSQDPFSAAYGRARAVCLWLLSWHVLLSAAWVGSLAFAARVTAHAS